MNQPSLDILMQKVDNKYTLVIAAAKWTRTLMEESPEGFPEERKPVSIALKRIASRNVNFEYLKEGPR